ncbi:hypothetical protein SAMN05421676_11617 [Salinibacillus kushneri]|uniref:Uncharacterized protein n=1 Tax=Salinibacillus kushneri TaxID=237682 RepID=A0A1I0J5U7_9BACI|nr:hypothetical protein SAMN05421676_11617 [Salinibacillus kushneri]
MGKGRANFRSFQGPRTIGFVLNVEKDNNNVKQY